MAITSPDSIAGHKDQSSRRSPWVFLLVTVALGLFLYVASQEVQSLRAFPDSWNIHLRDILNAFKRWVVVNRNGHWIFLYIFEPFSAVIDFSLRRVEDALLWIPWPLLILIVFLFADRIRGLGLALLTVACLLPMGLFGLWAESVRTLALMVTAVVFTILIGLPLGIWTARNDGVEKVLRPILDAMQTMPAFVYLIPVLLFFGVARVPSIIATVIYALPPMIRLTNLGLRAVDPEIIEAAESFGTTERQMLRKVLLPAALPTIMVGVNQAIMMALSIVVIAALIGAGGLGDVVLKALRRLQVGAALEAGLAIVLLAVLLDRLSAALAQMERRHAPQRRRFRLFSEKREGNFLVRAIERIFGHLYDWAEVFMGLINRQITPLMGRWSWTRRIPPTAVALLFLFLFASLILRIAGVNQFPHSLRFNIRGPVDDLVQWMQVNLYDIAGSGIGTGPLRNFLIIEVFQPLQSFLVGQVPWTLLLLSVAALALAAGGWRLALGSLVMTGLIGFLGMWTFAMDTLAQTGVAVLICVGFGVPVGIWAAHHDRFDRGLRPLLDFLQTIPIFVYLVPVIMLFGSGTVAGLIASVLYAAVPVIRLTSAGIRNLDKTYEEAAVSFGSSGWQILRKVEIPLAFPTIMLGVNQTIMMVLAMVIIAGLVGATGLGLEVYQGFANDNLGRSVEAGLAIVLMAIVIDRISQQLAQRARQAANLS